MPVRSWTYTWSMMAPTPLPKGSRMFVPAPVGWARVPVARVTDFSTACWGRNRALLTSRAENFTSWPFIRALPRSSALSFSSARSGAFSINFRSCSWMRPLISSISPFMAFTASIWVRYSSRFPSWSRPSAFSSSAVRAWSFSVSLRLMLIWLSSL